MSEAEPAAVRVALGRADRHALRAGDLLEAEVERVLEHDDRRLRGRDLRQARDPGPAREAELAELRAELRESLGSLPEQQARVVVLKDALGFSFAEISAADGVPVGTAKSHAFRGRAELRGRLDPGVAAA